MHTTRVRAPADYTGSTLIAIPATATTRTLLPASMTRV